MTMDYGYPHIHFVSPDTVPTIRVTASLFKDVALTDTLFTDTLKLVNDTLATNDLRYAGDWVLDLTKIDASKLAQDDSIYYMKATIIFDGNEQYNVTIPVKVESNADAIRPTTVTLADNEGTYTLSGLQIENSSSTQRRLPKGIYIRKGKKVIVK